MIKRLNKYLLTHYPLLWNTRAIWVIIAALIIHAFFFLMGVTSTTAGNLQNHYSLRSVYSEEVYTFSTLCSLGLIITWLIFYLRNNAFKNFYIIEPFHLAKQFTLIVIILFFSITFFDSFHQGIAVKTRSITSEKEMLEESTILNMASAFIPGSKEAYFKLYGCSEENRNQTVYSSDVNYYDTNNINYDSANFKRIREALSQPDAFTYLNYCKDEFLPKGDTNYGNWVARKNEWIINKRTDSIQYILDKCLELCKKYNIIQRLNAKEAIELIYLDSFHRVTKVFPPVLSDDITTKNTEGHFDRYALRMAMNFVDDVHSSSTINTDSLMAELYVAVILAIWLLCYRLFSRRVFLISAIGTIVWAIFFAFIGITTHGNGISTLYLALFALLLFLALVFLQGKRNKVAAGVLLNWHIYMLPFVILLIISLISSNYHTGWDYHYYDTPITESEARSKYPIGYWVTHHEELLAHLNLLFSFLYTTFFFTRLAKKWHIMPEE